MTRRNIKIALSAFGKSAVIRVGEQDLTDAIVNVRIEDLKDNFDRLLCLAAVGESFLILVSAMRAQSEEGKSLLGMAGEP